MGSPRLSFLDAPANVKAKVGTPEWARGVALEIRCKLKDVDSDVRFVAQWIEVASDNKAWRILGYASLELFLAAEIGLDPDLVTRITTAKTGTLLRELLPSERAELAKPLAEHGTNQHGGVGDTKSVSSNGTTAVYLTSRIARDRPDILERMKSGEFNSVRAAAIEAGFVKVDTPDEKALKALRNADNPEEVIGQFNSENEDSP